MSKVRMSLYGLATCVAVLTMASSANAINLLGYYEFEGNYNDSTANGNHAAPGQNPGEVSISALGFRGSAVDINDPAASGGGNTGGTVDIPINANPNEMPQVSFGGWFNLDTNNGFPGVMAIDNGGWDRGIHLNGNNWGIASGGNTPGIAPAPTGQWTYVVGTFNKAANRATLYVGNDSAGTQTTTSGTRADGGVNPGTVVIEIGRYDNQDLDALVDDAFVWDGELTDHQANAIRNLRLSSLDYSLLNSEALFNLFDAGSGTLRIGNTEWSATNGLVLTNGPGEVTDLGAGNYSLLLNDNGGGLAGRPIPEPATLTFAGIALALVSVTGRRRRNAA